MFIIGTVGLSILGNKNIGYILYSVHIVSSLIYAFLTRKNAPTHFSENKNITEATKNPFTTSVREACISTLIIGGYIVFFSVICELLITFSPFKSDIITAILCGTVEVSNGIIMLSLTPFYAPLKLALCSLFLAFSGICITLQTLDTINDLNISFKNYLKGKIIIAIISFVITYFIFSIYTPPLNVFNDFSSAIKTYTGYIFWASFIPSMIILFYSTKN